MKLTEAINTAIAYETKIRDVYREAAREVKDEVGHHLFVTLADEEQHHIDYLHHRLETIGKTGELDIPELKQALPSKAVMNAEAEKQRHRLSEEYRGLARTMLSRALQVEIETSRFYEKMTKSLPEAGRQLFARFLEIENGHIAIVQTELDMITRSGYWMDVREFDMED